MAPGDIPSNSTLTRQDSGYFHRDTMSYTVSEGPRSTLFDKHLEELYASDEPVDGVAFFESAGYYDDVEGNTVKGFIETWGRQTFWGEDNPPMMIAPDGTVTAVCPPKRSDKQEYDDVEEKASLDELFHDYMQSRAAVSKIYFETRKLRTNLEQTSSAFRNGKDTMAAIDRLRLKLLCDSDLEDDTDDEMDSEASFAGNYLMGINLNLPASSMAPYFGHLRVLKPGRVHLFGSFDKRWFYLDFIKGELALFARSYWKTPKGKIDMRVVVRISPINDTDFTIELAGEHSVYVRANSAEKMQSWITLLLYARKQARLHSGGGGSQRSIASHAFHSTPPTLSTQRASLAPMASSSNLRAAPLSAPLPSRPHQV
ncbi:hypothetical protein, variant [Aphanomyces invadans]|uniref:PH domain-containing protein n=1 Tax=Aphanomyces invadans TaxID=157072 RepID=A0A024TF96_9STRA|nr:hypothetical protein, variant [Aphanomyces invadans]ETV92684.1 hypothetical protein, variant [Aphanomyces invadans]|eukprot:XP_008878719.1 hypothetical protein, variant [Aphanomyces invadans]